MTAVTETMNWGTELWDQYDNLSLHTLKGIDFLEKYGQFVRDRASIECDYASKLSYRKVRTSRVRKEIRQFCQANLFH
ncbi:hypothetical protein JTB14_017508 [Gonioctena quinquepunctata]|nr:hypothetical protein JTB14_017508 [Gonioctena quinquepunctata]